MIDTYLVNSDGKKTRQSIVPIYLIGKKGVLLIGIPIGELSKRSTLYGQENIDKQMLKKILPYKIVASAAVWNPMYDPVRDIDRWKLSPLEEIKTVEEFLEIGIQKIGNKLDSGSVGFKSNKGLVKSDHCL